LLTGCLARPHLDKETFAFTPAPPLASQVTAGHRVLGIRTLKVAAPFAGREFVYRTGESSYDRDPYAEFMVPPAEALETPIRIGLRQTGVFGAVVEAGSASKPDTLAEIHVDQLFGDFRHPGSPTAVMTVRFVFFDAPNGMAGKEIMQREYTREIPLKAPTAAIVMDGWNKALAEILVSAAGDFAELGPAMPKP
jgi:hypothetical protein